MIVDGKVKQKDLRSVRVFYDSDYNGTVGIFQGKHEIYIEPSTLGELIKLLQESHSAYQQLAEQSKQEQIENSY